MELVDTHVQPDGLRDADLETLARLGVARVVVCADDGAVERRGGSAAAWLRHFEHLLTTEAARLRRHGLRPLFALGVHPAHAPWHGFEELMHRLPAFLSDPAAVALGSLGLRTLDERERFVLTRQLELAAGLRRPVVVSAPAGATVREVRGLVQVLRGAGLPPSSVLVERASRAAVKLLRACGFHVALDPCPGRLQAEEVVALVRSQGPEGFVLASHAGEGAADLLAVPGLAAQLEDAGLSAEVVARVGRDNALRFFGRA